MMRVVTRAAIALCACAVVLSGRVAHAQSSGSQPVVVGGLRPSSDGNYRTTDIKRLAQAQKLREILDEGTKTIAHRSILNHAALKAELGAAYMVDLFGCEGDSKCVVKVFGKLRSKAALVVYGDYGPKRKNMVVRLRLLELASGKLLAEEEFLVAPADIEDPARWNKALTSLFDAVGMTGTGGEKPPGGDGGEKPPGGDGGEKPPGGDGGEKPPGGDGGEKPPGGDGGEKPPGGDGGEQGGGASADELTDADFGEVTTQVTVAPQSRRDDVPWVNASSTFGMVRRRFGFKTSEDNEIRRPDGLETDWTAKVGFAAHVYPLAWRKGGGRLEQIGLCAEYARTDVSSEGGRETQLYAGLLYRIPVGKLPTNPTFAIASGFVRHDFVMLEDASVAFPSVSYRGISVGGTARAPIGTPRIAAVAGADFLFGFVSDGELFSADNYGPSRVGGLDTQGGIEVRPLDFLFIRLGARYTRFFIEFEKDGALSSDGAVTGGQDRYVSGEVSAGFVQ